MAATPKLQTTGSPLSEADYKQLNTALYILNELTTKIDQAEQAGLDVTDIRAMRDDAYTRAIAYKQTYFPGRA